jgi:hypothetical protein
VEEIQNEDVLPDDYPVCGDCWYIMDGMPKRSDFHNVSVGYLKGRTGHKEIRRCNAAARKLPVYW